MACGRRLLSLRETVAPRLTLKGVSGQLAASCHAGYPPAPSESWTIANLMSPMLGQARLILSRSIAVVFESCDSVPKWKSIPSQSWALGADADYATSDLTIHAGAGATLAVEDEPPCLRSG